MALIQSRFIYYAIFPAAQRQEICLKFAIRTLSWQSCQSWQTTWYEGGELNGTGRGTRSYRKQEQPKHGEGVAKTELKKQGQTNENIYIYVYILSEPQKYYATKTRTMLEHPRTALGSHWILGTISVRTPISYLHWMPNSGLRWMVDGGWKVLRSRAPAAGDSRCWFC